MKCKYQNQRQHLMEFYHGSGVEDAPTPARETENPEPKLKQAEQSTNDVKLPLTLRRSTRKKVQEEGVKDVRVLKTAEGVKRVRNAAGEKAAVLDTNIRKDQDVNIRKDQDDEYLESLILDESKRFEKQFKEDEKREQLVLEEALSMSAAFLAKSLADDRQSLREHFEKTELTGFPNILIQFRCPDGSILRRHFSPTDQWFENVFKFINCQEMFFEHNWAIFDPSSSSSPVFQSTGTNNETIAQFSKGIRKLAFIISFEK